MTSMRHCFALYAPELPTHCQEHDTLTLHNREVVHRVARVVRLREGDTCYLFNGTNHVYARVSNICRHTFAIEVISSHVSEPYTPYVAWYLPLLKREAWEQAVSCLTSVGVNAIYPMVTHASRQAWGNEKDMQRTRRVMIAAAEQAKQFCLPKLCDPVSLPQACNNITLAFSATGHPASACVSAMSQGQYSQYRCCVGPEGGFTDQEEQMMREAGVHVYRLTPTVLRSWQAVMVAAGMVRSIA